MFEPFTILENPNWKATFKEGHVFVRKFAENLNGYYVCGFNHDRKPRLLTLFLLKEDVEKCKVIEESDLLKETIESLRCAE